MDHRESRSRKKHSAKLGQRPFPSCVKNPERLGRRPEEVPCPWIQASGRPGMRCSSSLCTGGSWEVWREAGNQPKSPGILIPPTAATSGTIHLGLFKALTLVPSTRSAQRGDGTEMTHPTTPGISPGLSQDRRSTAEARAITTN